MLDLTDEQFLGINAATPAEQLDPGMLQEATNVLVVGAVGGQGGYLQTRPGLRGQLSAALGKPIYASTVFVASTDSGTVRYLIFAAGGKSDGRIYSWVKGAASATALTDLGTFDASSVQFARLDDYLFITGNTDKKLRRILADGDLTVDTSGGLAVGLDQPTYTLSGALGNKTLATFAGVTVGYDEETAPYTGIVHNLLDFDGTDWSFPGTIELWKQYPVDLWNFHGGDYIDPEYHTWFVLFDDQPSYLYSSPSAGAYALPAKENSAGYGVGAVARYPVQIVLGFQYKAPDAKSSILVTMIAYADVAGTTEVARLTKEYGGSTYIGRVVYFEDVFSFAGLIDDTVIRAVNIQVNAGPRNTAGDRGGPHASGFGIWPLQYNAGTPGDFRTVAMSTGSAGTAVAVKPTPKYTGDATQVYVGGQRFTLDLTSSKDWSAYQHIAIRFTQNVPFDLPRVQLGLRATTTATSYLSNDMALVDGGDGSTYLIVDLSTIAAADRTAIQYVELVFLGDITLTQGYTNTGQTIFTVGDLILAGDLSVGLATYEWRITETHDDIESQAGVVSNSLTPTSIQAQASLVTSVTPPTNSGASLIVWRRGGTFVDGLFRKVNQDVAGVPGFNPGADQSGPGWTWMASTTTFLDNVPDSALLDAEVLLDHEPPPMDATAVAAYAGRLALGTKDGLYLSQLAVGASVGLYYNALSVPNFPNAPNRDIQGFYTKVTGNEGASSGDSIQRLIAYQTRLVIFYVASRYLFGGATVDDFFLQRWQTDEGKGAIAPQAVAVFEGVLCFLSSDGLRMTDLSGPDTRLSAAIEPLLSPATFGFGGAALNAAAYAQSSLFVHAGRLFLAVPSAASGGNIAACYVYDTRSNGWVRWDLGAISGGAVFAGAADTSDLYVTDASGQIYNLGAAYGDKATPSASVVPVQITLISRKVMSRSASTRRLRAERLSLVIEAGASGATVALTVQGDSDWSLSYGLAAGENYVRDIKVGRSAQGRRLNWKVVASTATEPLVVRWVQLLSSGGEG